jgi:hypothetical protein
MLLQLSQLHSAISMQVTVSQTRLVSAYARTTLTENNTVT